MEVLCRSSCTENGTDSSTPQPYILVSQLSRPGATPDSRQTEQGNKCLLSWHAPTAASWTRGIAPQMVCCLEQAASAPDLHQPEDAGHQQDILIVSARVFMGTDT